MHLIVGATGSLGGTIARLLLERGERVRALPRPPSEARARARHTEPDDLRAWGAELVEGDLTRPTTLPAALDGVASVVCTATATKRGGPDTTGAVDALGTAALASAAAEAGVGRFVLVSTVGARPDAPHPLFRDKGRAEEAVRASGMAWTILQPVKFMQDWIGFLLGSQIRATIATGRPRIQLVGDGSVPQSFVDEGDVARLAVATLGRADAVGEAIPLAAEVATYRDLAERIGRVLVRSVEIETLPPGGVVNTVPEAISTTVRGLLTLPATSPPDHLTTPEVAARFGLELRGIDAYLRAELTT